MTTLDFVVSINIDVAITKEEILNNVEDNTGIKDMIVNKAIEEMNIEHDDVNVE